MGNNEKNNKVWLAWENQRRSTMLAKELKADLCQIESDLPRLLRYIKLSLKTIHILTNKRYNFIFVQNPSIVLCLIVILIKKFLGNVKIIIDSHTPYIKLKGIKEVIFNLITTIVYRCADHIIVTNRDLKEIYEKLYPKASFYALPDKIPEFGNINKIELLSKVNILLICTYAEDEPYIEVFKAMKRLSNATLYVTGKKSKISQEALIIKPDNVILTDYLPDSEYNSILNSVDIIIDLTEIENCLVCGAYEGLAAEKVLILSDKKVLKEYFDEGVIHTKNDSESIYDNIQLAIENYEKLKMDIVHLKSKRIKEWKGQWVKLLGIIGINEYS